MGTSAPGRPRGGTTRSVGRRRPCRSRPPPSRSAASAATPGPPACSLIRVRWAYEVGERRRPDRSEDGGGRPTRGRRSRPRTTRSDAGVRRSTRRSRRRRCSAAVPGSHSARARPPRAVGAERHAGCRRRSGPPPGPGGRGPRPDDPGRARTSGGGCRRRWRRPAGGPST